MTEVQVTSWRELPSLVVARDGDEVVKVSLPARFQEAIDEAAMRLGAADADAYLAGWERSAWAPDSRPAAVAAEAVAAGLEARWTPEALAEALAAYGGRMGFRDALAAGRIRVGDGAMGTMLQGLGLDDGGAPEAWNVDHPERVASVLEAYATAGANLLTTNTFGGTRPRLEMHGLGERVGELNEAAAQVARRVADRHRDCYVLGDVGPIGDLMEPMGTLTPAGAEEIFAEQISALVAGGVDAIVIETMSDLDEVRAAVAATRRVSPDLPIAATLSFDTNLRTMMGVTPERAVREIAALGVDVVGANCGRGTDEMRVIAAELVAARPPGVALIVASNAGLPELVGGEFVYTGTPEEMAAFAREVAAAGVDVIGACCGSTPEHVAAIAAALRADPAA